MQGMTYMRQLSHLHTEGVTDSDPVSPIRTASSNQRFQLT